MHAHTHRNGGRPKRTTIRRLGSVCMVLALCAGTAHAQQDKPPEPIPSAPAPDRWRILVSPYVWAASVHGRSDILGRSTVLDASFGDVLKTLDLSVMGTVGITNGTVGLAFDAQYARTSQAESVLGDQLRLVNTSTLFSVGAYYRIFERALGGRTLLGEQQVFAIEPVVGVRWSQVGLRTSLAGHVASHGRSWADIFVGSRVYYDLDAHWNLFAQLDVGGFGLGTRASVSGQAYLGYNSMLMNTPVTYRVGYRVLYQNYQDPNAGPVKLETLQHGPVLGLTFVY